MIRAFTDVLADIAGGRVALELTTQLAELTKAVEEAGKAGALTLKITVEPNGEAMVAYGADVSCKVPRPSYGKTTFFTDHEGGAHRRDPRQILLPLQQNVHPLPEKASV